MTQDEYNAIRRVIANNGIVIVKQGIITGPVNTFVENDIIVLQAFYEGLMVAWTIHYNLGVIRNTINILSLIFDLQDRVAALESK